MSRICACAAAILAIVVLTEQSNAQTLDRPIIPFDYAPVLSTLFRRLEQPIQIRTIYLYMTGWYNSYVVNSENGLLINGSAPLFRRGELSDNAIGIALSAVAASNTLHIFGEADALLVREHAIQQLGLDLPLRAEDVADDHPVRDDLLIGFQIASELQVAFSTDGMNDSGRDGGSTSNLRPFEDITGYEPLNAPSNIVDLRRWTPLVETPRPLSIGEFAVQRAIAPQAAFVETPLLPDEFTRNQTVPAPYSDEIPLNATCDPNQRGLQTTLVQSVCADLDEMLALNAAITPEQEVIADYFNDPVLSLDLNNIPLVMEFEISFRDAFTFVLLMNGGMYETTLLTWREKRRHDAVRPSTLVNHLYKDVLIQSRTGEILGQDFESFLRTPPRQEYPSLHAAQCEYYAEMAVMISGSTSVTIDVPVAAGASSVAPGVLPASDITFRIRDLRRDIGTLCGESRIWSGTSLRSSVERGREIGRSVAREYMNHLACLAPDNEILTKCQQ